MGILRALPEPKESFTGEGVNHYSLGPGNGLLSFNENGKFLPQISTDQDGGYLRHHPTF